MKPRLRFLAYASYLVACAVLVLTYVGQIWAVCSLDLRPFNSVWLNLVFFLVPFLAFWVTLLAIRTLCLWLGWLTSEEAASFPLRHSRWPDTWLEDVNDEHGG
jgi:hypothetical protein